MTTAEEPQPTDECRMCGQTYTWHQENFVRHPFTPANSPSVLRDTTRPDKASQRRSDAAITRSSVPFDPALRLALIEAGVITIQQLADAEMKLRIITNEVNEAIGEEDGNR